MNRSILITFAGGLLSAILTFLVNVVAAKYLIVSEFNQFGVFINSTVILSSVFEFGLSSSLIVLFKRRGRRYCEILASYSIALMCMLFVIFSPLLYNFWYVNGVVCLLASLLMTIHKVLNVFNQIDEQWGRYSFNNILSNFVKLAFVLLAVTYYPDNVLYALWALVLSYVGSITYILTGRNIHFSFKRTELNFKNEFKTVINFYIITALVALLMRVDVVIIDQMGFNAANYFIASTLCMLIPLLNSSVMAVLVKVGTHTVNNKHKVFGIIFIISGYLIFSKYVLHILYNEQYEHAANIMYILAIAYAIGLYFTDKESELYHQSNNRLLYLKIFQLIVMSMSAYPLIKCLGEPGMAYAVLFSRLSGWLYIITTCRNEKKI